MVTHSRRSYDAASGPLEGANILPQREKQVGSTTGAVGVLVFAFARSMSTLDIFVTVVEVSGRARASSK